MIPDSKGQELLADLHNKYALRALSTVFRIVELELYEWDCIHTHRNEKQRDIGKFYIHRTGLSKSSSYKGGTFKGIDWVPPCTGGVLIRGIQPLVDTEKNIYGPVIEGPCNVVNYLCKATGWDLPTLEENLQLIQYSWSNKDVMFGARVGLSMKKAKNDAQRLEMAKSMILPLRSAIVMPSKHKETFLATNPDRNDIPLKTVAKYREEFKAGKSMQLSSSMTLMQVAGHLS